MDRDTRQAYLRALDQMWPEMAKEFRRAMNEAQRNIDYGALRAAMQAADVDAAMNAINARRGLFGGLVEAIAGAFAVGGRRAYGDVVRRSRRFPAGARVIGGFDPGDAYAAEEVRRRGADLVQGILDAERDKIRDVLGDALMQGQSPDVPARAIAGEVVDGRRKGSLVGLSRRDGEYLRMMREALENPYGPDAPVRGAKKFWIGDDGKLKSAYSLRNKRYDGAIRRAIQEGRALNPDQANRALDGFRNKMLRERGETIARTEIAAAQTAGQDQAYLQLLEEGQIKSAAFEWDSTGDAKVRASHAAADGQRRPHGEPFNIGGYPMMGPGDGSMGAPASETVRCRCWKKPVVDFFEGLE